MKCVLCQTEYDNLLIQKTFSEYMIASENFKRNNGFLYESNLFGTVNCDVTVTNRFAKIYSCALSDYEAISCKQLLMRHIQKKYIHCTKQVRNIHSCLLNPTIKIDCDSSDRFIPAL